MLNYNIKNMYCISFIILLFICIFLFIVFDIYTVSGSNNLINNNSKRFYIIEKDSLKNNSVKLMFMNLKSTYLELIQIGDIYENANNRDISQLNNTNNDNVEDINQVTGEKISWRIKIPKINVDAPISEGTTQSVLATYVGHFEESAYWNGNVALAGHNRGYNCNFFEKLKKLDIGDTIIYSTENGTKEYKVILNKIIKQTDWSYIENTQDNRLTLITCVENMYEYRRCVQAIEV